MNGRLWIYLGMFSGQALAYGIGKALAPDVSATIAFSIIFGATALGAILGQIARGVRT